MRRCAGGRASTLGPNNPAGVSRGCGAAQAAKTAADVTASAATEAGEAAAADNALEATSKAAVAAWRASQAQAAAAAAEASALEAAKHARLAHTVAALTAAHSAVQSFNLVRRGARPRLPLPRAPLLAAQSAHHIPLPALTHVSVQAGAQQCRSSSAARLHCGPETAFQRCRSQTIDGHEMPVCSLSTGHSFSFHVLSR